MKWIEAKVVFDSDNKQLAADLISNVFYDFGLQGVMVDDPEAEPGEGWGEDAEKQPDQDAVTGYFPENSETDHRCRILEKELAILKEKQGIASTILYRQIDEEDWAESWKAYFWPEKISDKIVVRPTWREYAPGPDEIVVKIDPGMAFGTGTHPTSSLCVGMIERHLRPGDSFLDVGTGSGILMIAAAKLGAGMVWGIDIDDVAVEIARKNVSLNGIAPEKFKVLGGNLVDTVDKRFDVVVANILSDVIMTLLDSIPTVLVEEGTFICSGIIEKNRDSVLGKMHRLGFEVMEVRTKEKWVSIASQLKRGMA